MRSHGSGGTKLNCAIALLNDMMIYATCATVLGHMRMCCFTVALSLSLSLSLSIYLSLFLSLLSLSLSLSLSLPLFQEISVVISLSPLRPCPPSPFRCTTNSSHHTSRLCALASPHENPDSQFLRIAKIRKREDGCCCIAALLVGEEMYVINIGDSRAILASGDNTATPLSTDHKPENPDEKARVERAGGQVIKYGPVYRVTPPEALAWEQAKVKQGPRPLQLAIARSFGDSSLKTPRPLLVCTPEIRRVTVKPDDKLVLLGCDGVWDVLSNQLAVDTALKAVDAGEDARAVAGSVVNMAYQLGSTDNISVVAILFHRSASAATTATASTTEDDKDES